MGVRDLVDLLVSGTLLAAMIAVLLLTLRELGVL